LNRIPTYVRGALHRKS
ncbi:hypothetical protein VCHENC02_4583, partial [Vibrio harveyi]